MKEFNLEEYLKNPSQKVITRDGRDVRIICTDAKSIYKIVGLVYDKKKDIESLFVYKENGKYFYGVADNDLFFAPIKREGWINVYKFEDDKRTIGCLFESEEEAKLHKYDRASVYLKTIKIEWEE